MHFINLDERLQKILYEKLSPKGPSRVIPKKIYINGPYFEILQKKCERAIKSTMGFDIGEVYKLYGVDVEGVQELTDGYIVIYSDDTSEFVK